MPPRKQQKTTERTIVEQKTRDSNTNRTIERDIVCLPNGVTTTREREAVFERACETSVSVTLNALKAVPPDLFTCTGRPRAIMSKWRIVEMSLMADPIYRSLLRGKTTDMHRFASALFEKDFDYAHLSMFSWSVLFRALENSWSPLDISLIAMEKAVVLYDHRSTGIHKLAEQAYLQDAADGYIVKWFPSTVDFANTQGCTLLGELTSGDHAWPLKVYDADYYLLSILLPNMKDMLLSFASRLGNEVSIRGEDRFSDLLVSIM